MKRGMRNLVFIFVFILTISIISASFILGDSSHSIQAKYAPSDYIKGWINISFSSELADSLVETSAGGQISLIDLIESDSNYKYSCIPTDCLSGYLANSGSTEKNFDLTDSSEKIIGLKITGKNFNGVSSFLMNVESDAPESYSPQLYIDILNDNSTDWHSYKGSGSFQDKIYSECYNNEEAIAFAEITESIEYCQNITIPSSPNIELGADIAENTGGSAEIQLSIDDGEGAYGSCYVTVSGAGEINCIPADFKIAEEKDFFVCIKAKTSADSGKYKISYETTSPTCDSTGENDFRIFVKREKFASLTSFNLDNTELEEYGSFLDIEDYINNYVNERYDNNCTNECIIPIKFSGQSQAITLTSAKISYTSGIISTSTSTIYDLTESTAKINSLLQKLSLDGANLEVPAQFGTHDFSLELNGEEIFAEEISVEKIPKILSLNPNVVMAAYPAKFEVAVDTFDGELTVEEYKWIFDDGTETTTENKLTHTFDDVGVYNLTIEVIGVNSTSSKTFTITAEVPTKAIALDLSEKLNSISKLNNYIESLSSFYKDSITAILNLTEIETELDEISQRNATASSDQDYVNIMNDLMAINVPKNISTTKKAVSVPFYSKSDYISVDALKSISGKSGTVNGEEYKNAVIAWNLENVNMKVSFDEISANYDEEDVPLLRFFKVHITKEETEENPYFIISQLGNLKFGEDYSEGKTSQHYYIELKEDETEIIFSTTENVDFRNLPAFVSPKISELSVINIDLEEKNNNLIIVIAAIAVTIILGFIAYILMQKWYANKYESYLFKNRNDLYNIVSYIQNAKRTGMSEKDIISKLKKAKWKAEQIKYVLKKSAGKRTGMIELFKFNKKVNK